MKKMLCIGIALFFMNEVVAKEKKADFWLTSYKKAKELSIETNKPIFIEFFADWCSLCTMMDNFVWTDAEVQELLKNYIPLRIDFESYDWLKSKYKIKAYPTFIVADGWGEVIYKNTGLYNAFGMKKLLENFKARVSSIHGALAILKTDKKNELHNLRAGLKFQSHAFYMKGLSRESYLKRSNTYFTKALKYTREDNVQLRERIKLNQLLNECYAGNIYSSLAIVRKNYSEVHESNESLLNFLLYYCYVTNGEEKQALLAYEHLNSSDQKKAAYLNQKK